MIFDTHAHLDDPLLLPDVDDVLTRAREAGVAYINSVGCDWQSSLTNVKLAEKYNDMVYATVGIHPQEVEDATDQQMADLVELASKPRVIAWGEIGLDYHYDTPTREIQKLFFRKQIALAKAAKKPLVIHDRDSHQDILNIIKEESAGINGGILHCFSGSWEMAKECLSLGFMISFAGPLTFKNAKTPVEVARKVPLDMLLVETDSPYLTPHPFRGQKNEPAKVVYTAEKLAEIKGIEYEQLAEIVVKNAFNIFQIKK